MGSFIRRAEIGATALLGLLATTPVASAQTAITPPTPPNQIPAGMIAYYTQAGTPTNLVCPSGWSQFQDGVGRVILGTTVASEVGNVNNGILPTTDGQAPPHSHPFSAGWYLSQAKSKGGSGSNAPFAASGYQQQNDAASTQGAGPGYGFIQFLVCESPTPSVGDTVPVGTVAYFTTQSCPVDWQLQSTLNGAFPMPVAPNGPVSQLFNYTTPGWHITVNSTSSAPGPNSFPTHSHGSTTDSSQMPVFTMNHQTMDKNGIDSGAKASTGGVQITVWTGDNTTDVLPAVSLLVCQKVKTGSSTYPIGSGIPDGIALFYSQPNTCPLNSWNPAVGAPGDLVIGIGGSNVLGTKQFTQGLTIGAAVTPGTNPSHTHPVSVTANLGWNTSNYGPGDTAFAQGGSQTSSVGSTGPAWIDIPYVALLLCQVGSSSSS